MAKAVRKPASVAATKERPVSPPRVGTPTPRQANRSDKYVTIRVPVEYLPAQGGYQVSLASPPRRILNRRLTNEQGVALGSVRLGMLRESEKLNVEVMNVKQQTISQKEVTTKEDAVSRILELIAAELKKGSK